MYSACMKLKQKSDRVALCDITNTHKAVKPTLLQVPVQSSVKPVPYTRGTVCLPKQMKLSNYLRKRKPRRKEKRWKNKSVESREKRIGRREKWNKEKKHNK